MATSGITQIDLRNTKLLEYVNTTFANQFNPITSLTIDPAEQMLPARRFMDLSERQEPGYIGEFEVVTALRRQYRIYRDKQVIGDHFLTMPIRHVIRLNMSVVLGASSSLSAEETSFLIDCFNAFDPNMDIIEQFAQDCINKYNLTAVKKLESKSFDLFPKNVFTWISGVMEDSQEKWLDEVYHQDAKGLIPGLFPVKTEKHNLHDLGYEYKIIGEVFLTDFVEMSPTYQTIEVSKEIFADDTKLEKVVLDKAQESAQKQECKGSNPIIIRVTDAWWPDAYKTIWEWGYISMKCGGGFHFYTPISYHAEQKIVLFATTTYADPEERLRKIFESALNEAINETIVSWVISTDTSEILTAFKTLFWVKIKEKTGESIECLIPDLYIAIETKEWKKN